MRHTLQIGAMSAANILSNILFQWLVLTILGPGMESDALFAGMTVPQLFAAVVSSSLTHVLVPILAGESYIDQRRDGWTLLAVCGVLFLGATAVLVLTAGWWVPLTVPGFAPEAQALTIRLATISLLGMAFTGLNSVQSAMAFARERYISADAAPTIANLVAVALLFWALPRFGVTGAAWISVVRLALQTLLLQRIMGRAVRIDLRSAALRNTWKRLAPMLAGASYYKMDPLVDRFLLSSAQSGSLSLLYLAQQLYSAASQVVAKALAVPAITSMSSAHKRGDLDSYRQALRRTSLKIVIVCSVGVGGLLVAGKPLLALAMNHGEFNASDTRMLWVLLVLMAGQFVAGSLGSLTAGAFYARGDTRTPTVLGSIAFTLGIALKIAAFKLFGLFGLAVAISAYYLSSLLLQIAVLWKDGSYHSNSRVQT